MSRSFWRNKRVLVTGHTGFKGSWTVAWLRRLDAVVAGFALDPDTNPSLFNSAEIAEGITSILDDIRDPNAVADAVGRFQPEIVLHLAAQPLVRLSYERPVLTFATNVMGTVHLLEAVRMTASVRAVVVITTDKCYQDREWVWPYREDDRLGGYDPYASSKACAELVVDAYRQSFLQPVRTGVATARAGNVIGGGDWSRDRLIPDAVVALQRCEPVRIRNPHAVRPWQHVLDVIHGYLLLAQKLHEDPQNFHGPYNFGPSSDQSLSVGELVKRLIDIWGTGSLYVDSSESTAPHESACLRLDSSKARKILGWKPQLDINEALQWSVDWYRQAERNAARTVLEDQIERYQARLNAELPIMQ